MILLATNNATVFSALFLPGSSGALSHLNFPVFFLVILNTVPDQKWKYWGLRPLNPCELLKKLDQNFYIRATLTWNPVYTVSVVNQLTCVLYRAGKFAPHLGNSCFGRSVLGLIPRIEIGGSQFQKLFRS